MKEIFSAMFEGAQLLKVGLPPREMLEAVEMAYAGSTDVTKLFAELKSDWDQPDPAQEYRLLAPFKKREALRPDFLIAATFAELAAMTDMTDAFWRNAAYMFVLKNHVMQDRAKADDLKFAREMIGFIPPETPIITYLFSLRPETEWNARNFYASTAAISFEEWVKAVWPKMSRPSTFRCRSAAEQACTKAGTPERLGDLQTEWDQFSSLLGD